MNIALIGYGKMGKAIEEIALQRGHEIILTIDIDNAADLNAANLAKANVAIEFTSPHSAFNNVIKCLEAGTPVVCGSTGWLDKWNEVAALCEKKNGAMVYASNYSVGVNIFFEVNKRLAELMAPHKEYDVKMEEIHHTQKKDSPSGTAVTLAEQVLERVVRKKEWILRPFGKLRTGEAQDDKASDKLVITSKRIDPAPGTHKVLYTSPIDDIEVIHTAHNRTGFATGAVLAAEFIVGKKGIFSMKEVLGL